ncbi:hypothetical protein EV121DRAFT_297439 [Schizophyllum commune]
MADRRIKHSGSIDDILQGFDGIQIKGESAEVELGTAHTAGSPSFHREPALQPTKSDDREDTPAPCARSTTTHVPQRPSTSCQPTHEPPAGQCTLPANRRSHISHMSQKSVPSAGTRTARDRGVVSGAGNAPKSVLPKVMRSTCGEASSIGGSRSDQKSDKNYADRAAMSYTDRGTAVTQQSSNLTEAFMRKKALKDAKVIAQMQAARAIRPTPTQR